MVFTVAPRTPLLMAMWYAGKLFPRADRSPVMIPHRPKRPRRCEPRRGRQGTRCRTWTRHAGFYISQRWSFADDHSQGAQMKEDPTLSLLLLPFADAASDELPLGQLLRLSLFQVSVGMAAVMLLGTLNRVMIVELSRAGDDRRGDDRAAGADRAVPRACWASGRTPIARAIGWKRVPYLWFGSLWQMGGLAIMPFALLVLGGRPGPRDPLRRRGSGGAGLPDDRPGHAYDADRRSGAGLDRATDETRPRVVALLYVMFLVGMGVSARHHRRLLARFHRRCA